MPKTIRFRLCLREYSRKKQKRHPREGWHFIGIKRPETTILAHNCVKKAPNPSGLRAFLPCSVLKLMISWCEAVLGKVFFVLEKLKNEGILTYVHIFLCTISGKQQAKTVFSLRSTAVRGDFYYLLRTNLAMKA